MSKFLVLLTAALVVFLPSAHSASLPIRWPSLLNSFSPGLKTLLGLPDLKFHPTIIFQCGAGWGRGSWVGDWPGRNPATSQNVSPWIHTYICIYVWTMCYQLFPFLPHNFVCKIFRVKRAIDFGLGRGFSGSQVGGGEGEVLEFGPQHWSLE